jgi:diguanylate cyclase (GGDEF)-like protein
MSAGTQDGSWLCPTPLDRARLREMEPALAQARAVLYLALGIGAAASGPWLGWWVLLPVALSAAAYRVVQPRIAASPRPEYLIAFQVAFSQTLIAVTIALTGAAGSPVLVLSFLPLVTLPARFGRRGVHAGVAFTVLAIGAAVLTQPQRLSHSPALFILTCATLVGLSAFSDLLQRTEMRQRSAAVLDPLTGLLNRAALSSRFAEVREQARLGNAPVSLMVCDVDRFKSVNDEHGHARGDAVLKDIAYVMRTRTRMFELIYRTGGDELLVLLPGCTGEAATALAERLRADITDARPGGLDVTVSVGVGTASGAAIDFQTLFDEADRALYDAKAGGRNRVGAAAAVRDPAPAQLAA